MITKCNLKELEAITDLAYEQNNRPEYNSAYCFKDREAIKDDFMQMLKSKESFILGYFDDNELMGICGFYVDKDKKTVDLVGPFLKEGDYRSVSVEMLAFADRKLKKGYRYNFFFDQKNSRYLEFMMEIQAEYQDHEYSLLLRRNNYKKHQTEKRAKELFKNYTDEVKEIHDTNFKDSYLSGYDIISSAKNERKAVYITACGELAGYGSGRFWATPDRASIDIIYVVPKLRNQGYEQALLDGMIESIYENKEIEYIGMVIETDDRDFIEICIQAGFEITAKNCSYFLKE
jgi:ribosomal protein S18 acetylase RimI-like enzyme